MEDSNWPSWVPLPLWLIHPCQGAVLQRLAFLQPRDQSMTNHSSTGPPAAGRQEVLQRNRVRGKQTSETITLLVPEFYSLWSEVPSPPEPLTWAVCSHQNSLFQGLLPHYSPLLTSTPPNPMLLLICPPLSCDTLVYNSCLDRRPESKFIPARTPWEE